MAETSFAWNCFITKRLQLVSVVRRSVRITRFYANPPEKHVSIMLYKSLGANCGEKTENRVLTKLANVHETEEEIWILCGPEIVARVKSEFPKLLHARGLSIHFFNCTIDCTSLSHIKRDEHKYSMKRRSCGIPLNKSNC